MAFDIQSLVGLQVRAHIGVYEYQGKKRNRLDYYIPPIPRPLANVLVAAWLGWLEENGCPASGRNKWIIKAVRAGKTAGLPPEWTARLVLNALTRDPETEEIERAVRTVYDGAAVDAGERLGTKAEPDIAKTEAVVAGSRSRVDHLASMECNKARKFTFPQMVARLWQPYALICCGVTREAANVVRDESLGKHPNPAAFQFVVPNGMRKLSGRTQGGKESARSLDNACREEDRRWLVVECDFAKFGKDGKTPTIWKPSIEKWEAAGITVKDAAIRVVEHLITKHRAKLALVVDSGGKSLHCWLNVRDVSEEDKRKLMSDAVTHGADADAFTLNQWVRFPGGTRRNDNGTKARQEILFFNPDACPKPLQEKTPFREPLQNGATFNKL